MDKSSTEVSRLTLWGSNAETLDLSNAPILAAKNVRVSAKDDSLHVSGTINVFLDLNRVTLSGGDILVNPDPDMGWWDNEGYSQESRSITVAGAKGGDGGAGGRANV